MENISPKQIQLFREQFPNEAWATNLVAAVNQLSVQVTNALTGVSRHFQDVTFLTRPVVQDTFPVDMAVPKVFTDIHIAQVKDGTPISAVSLIWRPLDLGLVRLIYVYGLAPETSYTITLVME